MGIASWFVSCAEALTIARNEGGDRGAYSPPSNPHQDRISVYCDEMGICKDE